MSNCASWECPLRSKPLQVHHLLLGSIWETLVSRMSITIRRCNIWYRFAIRANDFASLNRCTWFRRISKVLCCDCRSLLLHKVLMLALRFCGSICLCRCVVICGWRFVVELEGYGSVLDGAVGRRRLRRRDVVVRGFRVWTAGDAVVCVSILDN